MKLSNKPWHPVLDWNTPAGKILKSLVLALPKQYRFQITVFGSAPLQLAIDPTFISADVDIFSDDDLTEVIHELRLGKGQRRFYIEQSQKTLFRTTLDWQSRAFTATIENVELCFPHPIDLLISKLQRLAPKDLRAFKLVRARTGFPKERDLIHALQLAVDLYRPPLPGEPKSGDMFENTRTVWQQCFHKQIDIQKRIIQPVLDERTEAYGLNLPDWKKRVARLKRPAKRKPGA